MEFRDWVTAIFNRFLPPYHIKGKRNIPYKENPSPLQVMDVWFPPADHEGKNEKGKAHKYPVIMVFHGGGWLGGDKKSVEKLCIHYAFEGFLVFNVNYRLVPEVSFSCLFDDIASAVEWVSTHAQKWGGDPEKLFMSGDSAGALLVAWFGCGLNKRELFDKFNIKTTVSSQSLKGLILYYGIFNMDTLMNTRFFMVDFWSRNFLGWNEKEYRERSLYVSPVYHINSSFPPVFISSGEIDPLHPQSVEMAEILKKHQIPHKALFFPRRQPFSHHAFMNTPCLPNPHKTLKLGVKFIKNLCL